MNHSLKGKIFTDIVLEIFKLSGIFVIEGDRLTKEEYINTAGWKVLGAIRLSDTPLTVPQIARKMGQTRQGVQRITNMMEKIGLISFQNNPDHKRAKLIILTDKGKDSIKRIDEKQVPWANSISETINEDDLKTAILVLQQLTQLFESKKG